MDKFIDIDKLVLPKDTVKKIQKKGVPAILDWLAEQESIEIIRCNDCKYFGYDYEYKHSCCTRVFYHPRVSNNDYCSYGEKRKSK